MAYAKKVLVQGAGLGGLALATALGHRGIETDVVEIKSSGTTEGIGISMPPNALRVLKAIGVLDDCVEIGWVLSAYRFFDNQANEILSVPISPAPDGVPGYLGISRPGIARILADAATSAGARIETEVTTAELDQTDEGVEVTLTNGDQRRYDVVAGFDGVRSQTRQRLFGSGPGPDYTGVACWRAPFPRPEGVDFIGSFQGAGMKAGWIVINDDWIYLWHLTKEPLERRKQKDDFRDLLFDRLSTFGGTIGEIRDNLPGADQILLSPLELVRLPAPWHKGRVVVGGDAAHAMSPNISQGGSTSLEDALVLAELLSTMGIDEALNAYGERRYPRCKFMQETSRKMLEHETDTDPEVVAHHAESLRENLPKTMQEVQAVLKEPVI